MLDNKMLESVQVLLNNQFPQKYKLLALLGNGSFSSVYKCEDQYMNTLAIKIISLSQFSPQIIEYMENEVRILQMNFENNNIIKLIDLKQTREYIFLVMEICLFDVEYLRNNYDDKKIPDDIVISILRQVANGLSFLHQNKIIHRDLKLENIGIYLPHLKIEQFKLNDLQSATFKLLDFGLSKVLDNSEKTNTFLGTPATMAPEILDDQQYSYEVDMYSLGCCLFRMVTGEFPYFEKKVSQLKKKIQSESADFYKIANPILRNLIEKMLKPNTKERITWRDLYQTELFVLKIESPISRIDISLQKNRQYYCQNVQQIQQPKYQQSQLNCDSLIKSQVSQKNGEKLDQLMSQLNIFIFTARAASQIQNLYSEVKQSKLDYITFSLYFKSYIKYLRKLSKFIYQDLQLNLQNHKQDDDIAILKNNVVKKQSLVSEIDKTYLQQFLGDTNLQGKSRYCTSSSADASQLPMFHNYQKFEDILIQPDIEIKENKKIYLQITRIIYNLFFQFNENEQQEKQIKEIKFLLNKCLILLAFVRAFLEKKVQYFVDSYLLEQEFCKRLDEPDMLLDELQYKLKEYQLVYD